MDIHFTARKFKARESIKEHATSSVKKLEKFYDDIVRADIILSFERSSNSLKTAEINLHVYGTVLTATERSEEFSKSVELAVEKLERQLAKYKSRTRIKNKKTLRKVKEKIVSPTEGDEE